MFVLLTLLGLTGCDLLPLPSGESSTGSTPSSAESPEPSAPSGDLAAGQKLKVPEKKPLIALGTDSSLPWPEEAITRRQCGDLTDGGPVDGCITAELECGDTIIGHTNGGVEVFDTRFYEAKFCTPATTNHSGGGERIYKIRGPEEAGRIYVTLDTPCADLDLAVLRWNKEDSCPSVRDDVGDCEMWPKDGRKRERVDVPNTGGWDFLAVVEGKDDEEGAFALTVQCGPWR